MFDRSVEFGRFAGLHTQSWPPLLRRIAPVAAVLLVAGLVSIHAWIQPIHWSPDGLYYEAKALSYRGQDEQTALHEAFKSPIADVLIAQERAELREHPQQKPKFTSSAWIDYSSRFFHRRILVPLIAAGIYPIFGLRSVLVVSLIGYLLLAVALFALLRRRFGPGTSAVAASICILAPPLRKAGFEPGTDTWGLLLEVCALLAAVLTFDRGLRWVAVWFVALAVLSITRDDSVVPLVAVGCLFLQLRERRSALLLGSGAIAIAPAVLIWGNASVRENLAFVFNGFNPPTEESWSFVLRNYPSHLWHLIHSDVTWGDTLGWQAPLWYLGIAAVLFGLALLVKRFSEGDNFFRLHTYAILGGAIFVGFFGEFSDFKQELVFLPVAAVALALAGEFAVERWGAAVAGRGPTRRLQSTG